MLHTSPSFIAVVSGLLVFGASGIILGPIKVTGVHTLLGIWRQRQRAST
jgi:predicted PurR-regulated permease PerM